MTPLARDLGDDGGPFRWDKERRFLIRAELDAFFFRLYGIERGDVDYIMETFQTESGGLKNNDIAKYGTYRTKDLIWTSTIVCDRRCCGCVLRDNNRAAARSRSTAPRRNDT